MIKSNTGCPARSTAIAVLLLILMAGGAGCAEASDDNDFEIAALLASTAIATAQPPRYAITAQLRAETNQQLQDICDPPVTVSNNGNAVKTIATGEYDGTARSYSFTVLSGLEDRTAYNITARNNNGNNCVITNGNGTIRTANATDIVITCPTP